ncbi:hypothetical protein Taro_007780, partial [Colocasia esculenta]|nr:hypothetical protein [Colocasia esculenta]
LATTARHLVKVSGIKLPSTVVITQAVTSSTPSGVNGFQHSTRCCQVRRILRSIPVGRTVCFPPHRGHLKHHSTSAAEDHKEPSFLSCQMLQGCNSLPSLRMTHTSIICCGLGWEPRANRLLVSMYVEFGDLGSAVAVLKSFAEADAPLWNLTLKAHVDSGLLKRALCVFCWMRRCGVHPDHYTFPLMNRTVMALHGCLELGEAIHSLSVKMGLGVDLYFCNTMIDVYVRYGYLNSARLLFDEMAVRDVVSWTSMLSGYVRAGNISDSLRLFREMQIAGFQPNRVTLLVILQLCSTEEHVALAKQLYGFALKGGLDNLETVRNSILTAFNRIGILEEAERIFNSSNKEDGVCWNVMISGYSLVGCMPKVIDCFNRMRAESVPSHETFTLVISACTKTREMLLGQMVHSHAVKSGQIDNVLQACLIDFYAKCGELEASVDLFEKVREKDATLWSTMISGFVQAESFVESIESFRQMQIAGFEAGLDIFRGIILACANLGSLRLGKGIHTYLLRNGWFSAEDRTSLGTCLLNMYARCGSLLLAKRCFNQITVKDVVAWSSIIDCYAIHGIGVQALNLFYQMQEEGARPNSVTFLSVLSACSHSGLVVEGCKVFDAMTKKFRIRPELNHYTCMVDLLGRAGKLEEAHGIINNMEVEPDGRIWGALLSACRTYNETALGSYAAQRLFDLEPENVGYHVVLCSIHASAERWSEAENMRKLMWGNDLKKGPGWSCIEVSGLFHRFVAGHTSHLHEGEIHEALACLTRQIKGIEACQSDHWVFCA